MGHVHADLMLKYAQDAMETSEPWKLWEVRHHDKWCGLSVHPSWHAPYDYRRKPKRISVTLMDGEVVSWPEPYTGALLLGTSYWAVGLPEVYQHTWSNSYVEQLVKEHGLIYLVKEDAKEALVARQLIFTQGM